jgi:DNA-binding response OmpR family regulator
MYYVKTPAKTKVLVADDDPHILQMVGRYLERLGYEVLTARDSASALGLVRAESPAFVVLDVVFQGNRAPRNSPSDGIEALRSLREWTDVPVLMLSGLNSPEIKIAALKNGADDYLVKPFRLEELTARIEAILRRTNGTSAGQRELCFRRLRIDPLQRAVWKDGVPVPLTKSEFDLLHALAQRPMKVFTRESLSQSVGRREKDRSLQTIDVHIRRIREKLEDNPARPTCIVTVRGTGYRFGDTPT